MSAARARIATSRRAFAAKSSATTNQSQPINPAINNPPAQEMADQTRDIRREQAASLVFMLHLTSVTSGFRLRALGAGSRESEPWSAAPCCRGRRSSALLTAFPAPSKARAVPAMRISWLRLVTHASKRTCGSHGSRRSWEGRGSANGRVPAGGRRRQRAGASRDGRGPVSSASSAKWNASSPGGPRPPWGRPAPSRSRGGRRGCAPVRRRPG
jgi:hypothetical protein